MPTFEPPRPDDKPADPSLVPPPPVAAPVPRPTLYDEPDPELPDADASGGRRWIVALIAGAVLVGGGLGVVLTRDGSKDATDATGTPSAPAVTTPLTDATAAATTTSTEPPATVPATEATAAPTTVETTVAPTTPPTTENPNGTVSGAPLGSPADPASANPVAHFVGNLGTDGTDAAPSTPAALYARWFRLLEGTPVSTAATADGFQTTIADGSMLELAGFDLVGGKVGDLSHCPGGTAAGACQRVSASVVVADLQVSGASTSFDARRLGEVHIGDTAVLFLIETSKTIARIDAPGLRVGFDGTVLSLSGTLPPSVGITVTFADGTAEIASLALAA